MSNNDDDKQRVPGDGIGHPAMPDNISFTMPGDDDEEVTRRVQNFTPNFGATTFATPMASPMTRSVFDTSGPSSTFSTTVQKGDVSTKSTRRSEKFKWVLKDVPTLPEFHPLERMAVFVPKTGASVVSGRISEVIRDRSIEATFDNNKGKVSCVTTDGVDFRIRLYRGREQYSHGIIVEIQRRFGTSINFFSDAKAILDASEGKTPQAAPVGNALPAAEEDSYKPNVSSSLGMVAKMLSHPGYDAQHLAMQTLSSLTDPAKVGLGTANTIARELVTTGNNVGYKVVGIILDPRLEKVDPFGVKATAMTVLANCLRAVPNGIPEELLLQILPVLRQNLMNADTNPRMAHIAAKCVEHIVENNPGVGDFFEALECAAEVGNSKHAGLLRQAELCLQKIGSR